MTKTQNLIFPHLSPFSEPWLHMAKLVYYIFKENHKEGSRINFK